METEKKGVLKLFSLFAEILEYPTIAFYECIDECISVLEGMDRAAARVLNEFAEVFSGGSLSVVQEIHSRAFLTEAACQPCLRDHLFADEPSRAEFLEKLRRHYDSHGFSPGRESPDHLAVVLRFLAESPGDREDMDLLHEGVIPALEKMLARWVNEGTNPYRGVLQALLLLLLRKKWGDRNKKLEMEKDKQEISSGQKGFKFQVEDLGIS